MPMTPAEAEALVRSLGEQRHSAQMTQQLLGGVATAGGMALAGGAGARGLWGLYQQLSRNRKKPRTSIPAPIEVEIPVEDVGDKYAADKQADNGVMDWAGEKLTGAANWAKDTGKKYLGGGHASTLKGHPLALPGVTLAAAGGLYGGWTLADWLMDKRRKQVMKQELDQAKQEYNDALFGKLSSVLDELYDTVQAAQEKRADPGAMGMSGGDMAGMIGGGALTLTALTTLLAGRAGYNQAASRSRRKLVEKAQKERQRARYEAMPSPMYAVPVPVQRDTPEDEESPFYAGPKLATVEAAHSGL